MPMIDSDKLKSSSDAAHASKQEWYATVEALQAIRETRGHSESEVIVA